MELVVVIGVIAVLAAITLVAVSRIRERSRVIQPLTALRQFSLAVSMYATQNKELMPAPELSGARGMPDNFRNYFAFSEAWRWYWGEQYAGLEPVHPAYSRSFASGSEGTYIYAQDMYSEPGYWSASAERSVRQLRPQRIVGVTFPSLKAVMISPIETSRTPYVSLESPGRETWTDTVEYGFADGSAGSFERSDLVLPDLRGENVEHGFYFQAAYGLHTADGLNGRDVRAR